MGREKNGTRNRTGTGPAKGSQGGGKLLFFGFLFFFFLLLFFSSSFLWTRISEYPHGRALVKVFSGGEGGFSLFKKKGSVGHSLPSVTLVSSLVVVLF